MRHIELIVETAEKSLVLDAKVMLVDTEDLLSRILLVDAVVVVEARLRTPADMERRIAVLLAPLHDLGDLFPVGDLLEGHLLDGRTRDDEAIILLVAHLGERAVEFRKIVLRRMLRHIRLRIDEVDLDLQRRIAQKTQKLRLRHRLVRHEVQDQKPKWSDVLAVGAFRIHDEDVLTLQHMRRRQAIRYFDRHETASLSPSGRAASIVIQFSIEQGKVSNAFTPFPVL